MPKQKADHQYFYITVGLFGVGIILGIFIGMNLKLVDENTNQKILGNESEINQAPQSQEMMTQKIESSTQEPERTLVDEDAILGDKDAKVAIVEFSDYECPTCKKAFDTIFTPLEKEYIKTGKVRYIFRDFPLNQHTKALIAAEAAECAGEQDHYFDMHSKLFTGQSEWAGDERKVDESFKIFRDYAQEIKLNTSDFDECVIKGSMENEITHDIADGEKYKVEVTPTYFINDKMYKGIQKYEALKALIDGELK